MTCSRGLSICVLNTPRPDLAANTRWACRLPATLRPRRVLGSGSRLGVAGRRYVACYEVPPVPERHAESAPVGAVRPRPIRVEPRPGATPDAVSYTHLRAHETDSYLVCRLLLEKKKNKSRQKKQTLAPQYQ